MKKIFFICSIFILIFFININSANANNYKFAQVADLHFNGDKKALQKIIQDINKTPGIDFVVFTGDNVGKATNDNLTDFLKTLKKLRRPYYLVLGTKDVSKPTNMTKKNYVKIVKKYTRTQPRNTNYVFKRHNLVFLVVDGSKEVLPSLNGYYNKPTLDWVDKQLTKYKFKKVIILQHYPIANKTDNEMYYTYNAIEYLQMLSKHNNVIAVVTGHFHKNNEVMYNGVYHITTPSASNCIYKIIEVDTDNDNQIFTMLKDAK